MMKSIKSIIGVCTCAALVFFTMQHFAMSEENNKPAPMPVVKEGQEVITLGAGCFWCVEAVYKRLDGVVSVTSGYMGGTAENPKYEDVIKNNTGEVEVVHIVYDPKKISSAKILEWFWQLHDPTQKNGQGGDVGPQYLSTIFYHSKEQKEIAVKSMATAQENLEKPIATRILVAKKFHPAEVHHQDYYRLNKNKNPYCRAVITPKMEKLKLEDKPDVNEK